ncbi:MAG: penicillin-binding protein 2 [Alphaproteobacteria bacterium]|nr:penicillin-binding protein 2 [Alphaproteobacteria bacterium]
MFEVGRDILQSRGCGGVGATTADAGLRLRFVYSVFTIVFVVFIAWTLKLGIQGTSRTRIGVGQNSWEYARADILDRNGEILAKNIISGHIALRPGKVQDFDYAAASIHDILPEYSVQQALALIRSGKKFIYLKKFASESQRAMVKAARIEGLGIEETEWRKYPKRRLTAHVVGFIGTDGHGLEGVEQSRDLYLRENKSPLVLSIDARIQTVFYRELSSAMQKFGAHAAMGMLMNSRTGEMIAMVSLPDFDPEDRESDSMQSRMFYPIRGVFELGSIFKVFNTAMAMETGIGLDKQYYIKEPYKIMDSRGRQLAPPIRDVPSFKPPRPHLNVAEILLHSCNVGSVQIALDMPQNTQREFFERLNMDRPLDLEFGRTEKPLMPQKWGPVERATVSFGHGIAVTPMHLLLGINSVVNGFYVEPTIIKRPIGEMSGARVVSPAISDAVRKILFKIAETTGGRSARVAGINIGGKTATAEKRVNGKIDTKKNLTSFTAVFPIESPQYIMMVLLDEPKGTEETHGWRTAAWNSAPTAGAIMDGIMPLLFQ